MRYFTTLLLMSMHLVGFSDDFNEERNKFPLIPKQIKTQFAGNIGFLSIGFGNLFLNNHLNSCILVGYVPKFIGAVDIVTFSQKNTFIGRNLKAKPINRIYPSVGFSINIESGNNSFLVLPNNYPENYYTTNAITFSTFAGLTYQGKIHNNSKIKQLEYFVEIGTLATYIYYSIESKKFNPNIFSLAFGININLN